MSNKAKSNRKGDVRRAGRKQSTKQRHERLFARIVSGEGQVTFTDITSHLGQPCPFNKPQAFMAVRASDDVCAFHLLHLSKKKSKEFGNSSTTMPTGGLSRLERRSKSYDLAAGDLFIEISSYVNQEDTPSFDDFMAAVTAPAESTDDLSDLFSSESDDSLTDLFADESDSLSDLFDGGSEEAAPQEDSAPSAPVQRKSEVTTWQYSITTDSSGLAEISPVLEEEFIVLDTRPVRASVYMLSPVTKRPIGLSFIGFIGKAGEEHSLSRVAGKILASALHLPVFQSVAGMTGVALDTANAEQGYSLEAAVGTATFTTRVFAFDAGSTTPEASGEVTVTANLEYADVTRGRLHFSLEPDAQLGENFQDKYEHHVTNAIATAVSSSIGKAGMHQIIKDIVNGGVTADTVEQIVEAGQAIGGLDIAADGRWRHHS